MGIDIAGVMDVLRMMAVERQVPGADSRGEKFNRSFLRSVRRHGRVYEVGMLAAYKLRSGEVFADVDKVPKMLAKGKLSLLPNRSGEAKKMRQIFRRAEEEEKKGTGPICQDGPRPTYRRCPASHKLDLSPFSNEDETK
jgi:heterodisulfide reductase subunit C